MELIALVLVDYQEMEPITFRAPSAIGVNLKKCNLTDWITNHINLLISVTNINRYRMLLHMFAFVIGKVFDITLIVVVYRCS